MEQEFRQKLLELGVDECTLFRLSHIRVFNRDVSMVESVVEYSKTKVLPPFVVTFLKLSAKEKRCDLP